MVETDDFGINDYKFTDYDPLLLYKVSPFTVVLQAETRL